MVTPTKRRWFLQQCGIGLGQVALASLLAEASRAEGGRPMGRVPTSSTR